VGETVLGEALGSNLGGKGANQAVALRRLNVPVALLAAVGVDDPGRAFHEMLGDEGIVDLLIDQPEEHTGVAVPMIVGNGDKALLVAPGAALSLSDANVVAACNTMARRPTALVMQLEISEASARAVVSFANEAGIPIFLNFAPVREFGTDLLAHVRSVVMNAEEARSLIGQEVVTRGDAERAAKQLAQSYGCIAVVTIGASGLAYADASGSCSISAFSATTKDATGAGDAFCAAFVAAMIEGCDINHACTFAAAAASLACRTYGAIPAMPWRKDVDQLLDAGTLR
jgi:ribokinase